MKKLLIVTVALALFATSCAKEDLTGPNEEIVLTDGSDFYSDEATQIRNFDFNQHKTWSGQITINGYEGPLPGIPLELYNGEKLIETGWTDENGVWKVLLNHTEAMDLKVVCAMPTISGTYPIVHNNFEVNISPELIQAAEDAPLTNPLFKSGQTTTRSRGNSNWYDDRTYAFQSTRAWMTLPTMVDPDTLSDAFLTSIANSVPEQYPVAIHNPSLLADGSTSLHLAEAGDVWMTFVDEGAGYKNAVGIFTYDNANIPTTALDIDTIWTVFENFSRKWSGGGLLAGDKVYIGSYPAGTYIGFALIANGYVSNSSNFRSNPTYYSIPGLNPETNASKAQHNILLYDDIDNRFVIGFEDLQRSSGQSDEDFNDALFYCTANPPTAIDTSGVTEIVDELDDCDYDGVPDVADVAPCDARYATTNTTAGKLMFEDLYPFKGDYDFNDIVVDYDAVAWKNGSGVTTKMDFTFTLKADGGSLTNGFGLSIDDLTPSMVGNTTFTIDEGEFESTDDAVFIFTEDMSWTGVGMMNNTNGGNRSTDYPTYSVSFEINGAQSSDVFWGEKMNPFIFQTTTDGKRNEVHLKYKKPTAGAAFDSIGTGDDITLLENTMFSGDWTGSTNSVRYWANEFHTGESTLLPATSVTYTDRNGYPWAMHVDRSVKHANERILFTDAYPNFSVWISSGGDLDTDWFRTAITGKVFE